MSNRSKDSTRTKADLSDAARPDDRMGDDLEGLDPEADERSASGSRDDDGGLLAEGEPVGPWSDEEEEENAFDAASDEEPSDEDAPAGYQAGSSEGAPDQPSPRTHQPKRRRSH